VQKNTPTNRTRNDNWCCYRGRSNRRWLGKLRFAGTLDDKLKGEERMNSKIA